MKQAFQTHLNELKANSEKTRSLLEVLYPGHKTTNALLSFLTDALFEELKGQNLEIHHIKEAANVLKKLTSTLTELKNLQQTLPKEYMPSQETNKTDSRFSKKTLEAIERKLNLL